MSYMEEEVLEAGYSYPCPRLTARDKLDVVDLKGSKYLKYCYQYPFYGILSTSFLYLSTFLGALSSYRKYPYIPTRC